MVPPQAAFIDANLLVLLAVGGVDPQLIAKHKRLNEFTPDDYVRLTALLQTVHHVCVTPNVLTEASNLISQHRDPQRSHFLAELKWIIERSCEIVVKSVDAACNPDYKRLGLTDSALMEAASEKVPLITVDLRLYVLIVSNQEGAAYNFRSMEHEDWPGSRARS